MRSPGRWLGALSTLGTLRRGTTEAERPRVWFKDHAPQKVSLALSVPPCVSDRGGYLSALQALLNSRLAEVRAELRRQGRGYLGRVRVRKTAVTDQPTTKKPRFGRNPTFSALTRAAWFAAVKQLRAFTPSVWSRSRRRECLTRARFEFERGKVRRRGISQQSAEMWYRFASEL